MLCPLSPCPLSSFSSAHYPEGGLCAQRCSATTLLPPVQSARDRKSKRPRASRENSIHFLMSVCPGLCWGGIVFFCAALQQTCEEIKSFGAYLPFDKKKKSIQFPVSLLSFFTSLVRSTIVCWRKLTFHSGKLRSESPLVLTERLQCVTFTDKTKLSLPVSVIQDNTNYKTELKNR